jgi:hypothetical protein
MNVLQPGQPDRGTVGLVSAHHEARGSAESKCSDKFASAVEMEGYRRQSNNK